MKRCGLREGIRMVIYSQGTGRDKDEGARKDGSRRCWIW
jgi:hypothetical protein